MKKIEKPWGWALRVARTERYAATVMFIRAGAVVGPLYHTTKDESIYMQSGRLKMRLGAKGEEKETDLRAGDSLRIPPGLVHHAEAIEDCLVFEASTPEVDDVVLLEGK